MIYFLVGFMGSGKSTLGKVLSRELGCEFVDMDGYISQAEGISVGELFATRGEAYFRECESQYLRRIIAQQGLKGCDTVVATGGGAPCHGSNMELMNQSGVTIYLKMDQGMLLCRLTDSKIVRPKIEGLTPSQLQQHVASLLRLREPYYLRSKITVLNTPRDGRMLVQAIKEYVSLRECAM